MKHNEVIKYPILSEKSYALMSQGVYTFAVDTRTNKTEIKKAVELIFDVKVRKVNIANKSKRPTKLGKSEGFTNRIKKAVVYLAEGQINIFPDEAAPVEAAPEVKAETAAKSVEPSEAEKKAAAKIAAAAKAKEETKEETK